MLQELSLYLTGNFSLSYRNFLFILQELSLYLTETFSLSYKNVLFILQELSLYVTGTFSLNLMICFLSTLCKERSEFS